MQEKCKNSEKALFDAKFKIFYFSQISRVNIEIIGLSNKRHTLSVAVEPGENPISFTLEDLEGSRCLIKFDLISRNNVVVDSIYSFVFAPKEKKEENKTKVYNLYQLSGKWTGDTFFDGINITELDIKPAQKAPLDHTHAIAIKAANGRVYNSYLTYINIGEDKMLFTNPSSINDVESSILINLPGGYVLGEQSYYRDILGSRTLIQLLEDYIRVVPEGEMSFFFTKLKGIKELKRWRFNPGNIEQILERIGLNNADVFRSNNGYNIDNLEILLVEGRCSEKAFSLCNKHQGGDVIKLLVQQVYMQPAKFIFNRGV